jgi:hypothetical protein
VSGLIPFTLVQVWLESQILIFCQLFLELLLLETLLDALLPFNVAIKELLAPLSANFGLIYRRTILKMGGKVDIRSECTSFNDYLLLLVLPLSCHLGEIRLLLLIFFIELVPTGVAPLSLVFGIFSRGMARDIYRLTQI